MPRCRPPKFCDYRTARKLMIFSSCLAILLNVPYCLIYTYNAQGDLVTTSFFHSWWVIKYNMREWKLKICQKTFLIIDFFRYYFCSRRSIRIAIYIYTHISIIFLKYNLNINSIQSNIILLLNLKASENKI